jgi:hypothetical protein
LSVNDSDRKQQRREKRNSRSQIQVVRALFLSRRGIRGSLRPRCVAVKRWLLVSGCGTVLARRFEFCITLRGLHVSKLWDGLAFGRSCSRR